MKNTTKKLIFNSDSRYLNELSFQCVVDEKNSHHNKHFQNYTVKNGDDTYKMYYATKSGDNGIKYQYLICEKTGTEHNFFVAKTSYRNAIDIVTHPFDGLPNWNDFSPHKNFIVFKPLVGNEIYTPMSNEEVEKAVAKQYSNLFPNFLNANAQ